jgi:uncharacterized membrane protein
MAIAACALSAADIIMGVGLEAADGIARAVRRCGEMLAHTLPPLEGDRDEIPDRLILSD